MPDTYDFQGRFDVARVDDGVVFHVPEPGERHIFVPRAEWEALVAIMKQDSDPTKARFGAVVLESAPVPIPDKAKEPEKHGSKPTPEASRPATRSPARSKK